MILGLIGISMPVFWLGSVLQPDHPEPVPRHLDVLLGAGARLQAAARRSLGMVQDHDHPWTSLAILYIGLYGRVLRASLIEANEEDYIRTARSKGLTETRILFRHALRTSLITFVTLFGLDFGALVGGGALLTEVVFGLQGRRQAHL